MVVKCPKINYVYSAISTLACILAGILTWFKFGSTSAVIIITVPALLLVIRFFITICRTIIFEKEGCTVKFLGIKQSFKWDELKTKKVIDLTDYHGQSNNYIKSVIFSPDHIRNPFRLMPFEYNSFFIQPGKSVFGFFYLNLDSDPKSEIAKKIYNLYAVNEKEFTELMKEWNVSIEGL